jgi:hypothetical protein
MTTLFQLWARAFLWWLQRQPLSLQRRYFETALRQGGLSRRAAFQVAMQIRVPTEHPNEPGSASNGAPSPGARGD